MDRARGLSDALGAASSALGAYATEAGTTAHNIANVSTDGFHPLRTEYQATGNGAKAVILPEAEGREIARDDGENFPAPSGVELAGEFANLIASRRAFEANARVITTIDDTMGTVLNIKG